MLNTYFNFDFLHIFLKPSCYRIQCSNSIRDYSHSSHFHYHYYYYGLSTQHFKLETFPFRNEPPPVVLDARIPGCSFNPVTPVLLRIRADPSMHALGRRPRSFPMSITFNHVLRTLGSVRVPPQSLHTSIFSWFLTLSLDTFLFSLSPLH